MQVAMLLVSAGCLVTTLTLIGMNVFTAAVIVFVLLLVANVALNRSKRT